MKYKTHNQDDLISIDGTHLQGVIQANFDQLVKTLGNPLRHQGDKVQAEWAIEFNDGHVATLYDWKEYDTKPERVTEWHIGGRSPEVVQRVINIVKGK
jgi:hypothetical protein